MIRTFLLDYLIDAARAVRFFSRLAMPALPGEADPHARMDADALARGLPLAGIVIGLPSALCLAGAIWAGLAPLPAAALSVAMAVLVTRGLHEDGLSDTADGLGGGGTAEKRLAIMRDSRIGAFGACALVTALMLRVTLLAQIADEAGAVQASAAILAVASLSRVIGLSPLAFLPPARSDGLAHGIGLLTRGRFGMSLAIATAFAILLMMPAGSGVKGLVIGIVFGIGLAGLAAAWLVRTARRLIGGQTGDIAGATQQIAEIGLLAGLAAGIGGP